MEWPGWCRAGRDEAGAIQALLAYAPRYQLVASAGGFVFDPKVSVARFDVVDRIAGNATTDFGALASLATDDRAPLTALAADRLRSLLTACWARFDVVLRSIPLRKREAKRAVGRSPAMMRFHLLETDVMHLAAFGHAYRKPAQAYVERLEPAVRSTFLAALAGLPHGESFEPARRYGFDWTPRFAVRRSAWHALDHAWQLEDTIAKALITPLPSPPSDSRPPATRATRHPAARHRSPAREARA